MEGRAQVINVYDFREGTNNFDRMHNVHLQEIESFQINDLEKHSFSSEDIEKIRKVGIRVKEQEEAKASPPPAPRPAPRNNSGSNQSGGVAGSDQDNEFMM